MMKKILHAALFIGLISKAQEESSSISCTTDISLGQLQNLIPGCQVDTQSKMGALEETNQFCQGTTRFDCPNFLSAYATAAGAVNSIPTTTYILQQVSILQKQLPSSYSKNTSLKLILSACSTNALPYCSSALTLQRSLQTFTSAIQH